MAGSTSVIGVDIGGTFTDVVSYADGRINSLKLLSTRGDYADGVLAGIDRIRQKADGMSEFSAVAHATTVATNAVLERRGAVTGLITTRGFRDVLEIGRLRHPILYSLDWTKPEPLVPRNLRLEVNERVAATGEVLEPLDLVELEHAVQALVEVGVTSVALAFINSYANISHESAAQQLIMERFEGVTVSSSIDVIREIREFERTSTTVLDAYVKPVVSTYLDRLMGWVGSGSRLYVMQSNGGMVNAEVAKDNPVRILESGPAAGVVAAVALARQRGDQRVLTFDMGGTTAKAGVIESGVIGRANEFEVGSDISGQARVMTGSGYLIRLPVVDIAEVGAGGGSIAWLDPGGAVRVGPESAGADPGPASYGRGGTRATVTDANVALGYIDIESLPSGSGLDPSADAAASAVEKDIASPSNMALESAAAAVHQVCNATMMRAIRAVSTERGRDAREYTLYAFGGSGPVHAASLAALLGIRRIIIPPVPGTLSALGLLLASVEQDFVLSAPCVLEAENAATLANAFGELQEQADASASDPWLGYERSIDLRYHGQQWEITLPAGSASLDESAIGRLLADFHREHQATYRHSDLARQVDVVNVRLKAKGRESPISLQDLDYGVDTATSRMASREVYDVTNNLWVSAPVLRRHEVGRPWHAGPLLVEEDGTVTVVPMGWQARSDAFGCLELRNEQA